MSEKQPTVTIKEHGGSSTLHPVNEGQTPLFMQALMHKNPHIGEKIQKLQRDNIPVYVRRLRKTPYPIRTLVNKQDTPDALLGQVFREPSPDDSEQVQTVRKVTDTAIEIWSPHQSQEHQTTIAKLNTDPAIEAIRKKTARRRLLNDRPLEELVKLGLGGIVIGATAVGATILEAHGQEGLGLFAAQVTDDVTNTANVGSTEGGGKKGLGQVLKENITVVPILAGAAYADHTFIPDMLASSSLPLRLLGAGLFATAAVGGSFGVNVLNVNRTRKILQEQDTEGERSRMDTAKEALRQNLLHPFRKYLWAGMGAALVVAEISAGTNILVGESYSGTLQTIDGALETIGGFAGLLLTNAAENAIDHVKNWYTVHLGKKQMPDVDS